MVAWAGFRGIARAALAAALVAALIAPPSAARAQEAKSFRIGYGFGIAFLPHMVMQELKLIEKHGERRTGAPVPAEYTRFSGSAAMQDAILSGNIDMGGYGIPALLIAWEKTRGTASQVLGVTGITTAPLVLVTSNAGVRTIKDFGDRDRIAMPALISPQMYVLQLASEQAFGAGRFDALKSKVVAMPHPEALNALRSGTEITAYFSAAPFTQIALKDPKIHAVLNSQDVFGGKASFLVNASSKRFADRNPKLIEAALAAMEEAVGFIRENPRRAAEIYLAVEPSQTLTPDFITELVQSPQSGFDVGAWGVKAYGELMVRLKQLKSAPSSWKDVFHPVLYQHEGS